MFRCRIIIPLRCQGKRVGVVGVKEETDADHF